MAEVDENKVTVYAEIGGTSSGVSTLNFTYSIPNTQCVYLISEE